MNQTINISLPKTMHQDLKDLVEAGHFSSVSEAIRAGINQIKTALHPKYKIPTYQMSQSLEDLIIETTPKIKEGKLSSTNSVSELI
jgi:Arc/MetJ-type ribon-helix-helix transcriptional regulator